jgi:hypothetical protein
VADDLRGGLAGQVAEIEPDDAGAEPAPALAAHAQHAAVLLDEMTLRVGVLVGADGVGELFGRLDEFVVEKARPVAARLAGVGVGEVVPLVGRHQVAPGGRRTEPAAVCVGPLAGEPVVPADDGRKEDAPLVVAQREPDPARGRLAAQTLDEGHHSGAVRPAVDQVAVEHENVVVARPVQATLVVGLDHRVVVAVVADGPEGAPCRPQVAVDVTDADDEQLPVDAVACRPVQLRLLSAPKVDHRFRRVSTIRPYLFPRVKMFGRGTRPSGIRNQVTANTSSRFEARRGGEQRAFGPRQPTRER